MLRLCKNISKRNIFSKRFYAEKTENFSTKDNSYKSYKSCELKKTHSVISSNNNSMNNSGIFNDTDFKFDSQSETAKPSKFKKMSSADVLKSPMKIETAKQEPESVPNFPLTSRKSDNLSCSKFAPLKTTSGGNKTFDFNRCNTNSFSNTSATLHQTTVSTNTSHQANKNNNILPLQTNTNNNNFPFTHDFTKKC